MRIRRSGPLKVVNEQRALGVENEVRAARREENRRCMRCALGSAV